MLPFIDDGMNIQGLLMWGFFRPFFNSWVFKWAVFRTPVSRSITIYPSHCKQRALQEIPYGRWLWTHVSLEWYSQLLSLIKRSEFPQKIIICCADLQRICAVGRELWALFHLKKNVSKEAESCSLCHAEAVIDFRVALEWATRDLHKQLQGNWQISTWELQSHWLIWISDCCQCETLFAQGWPLEVSALQLSVKSFLGELNRRKGKCKRSGCLVWSDLIGSCVFLPVARGDEAAGRLPHEQGRAAPSSSPVVHREDTSADLEWGDYSKFKQTTLKFGLELLILLFHNMLLNVEHFIYKVSS